MAGALFHADKIVTVSKTYAQEILGQEYGEEMDGLLRIRVNDLSGIINGIDVDRNEIEGPDARPRNKIKLQQEFRLTVDSEIPILAMATSRIAAQKNQLATLELIKRLLIETAGRVQFVLIGKGHPKDPYYYEVKKTGVGFNE